MTAFEINDQLLCLFKRVEVEYISFDKIIQIDEADNYPVEFLNSLNPLVFPAHIFILK